MEGIREKTDGNWDLVIQPKTRWYDIDIAGVWHYRDLVALFVKRDFIAQYKQTILGPLWMLIQPLLTVLMFAVVFGQFARIPTGGAPQLLFYLAAYVPWMYFNDCFSKNSTMFVTNAAIFGKVYFPRLVRPVSVTISSVFRFLVQMAMFTVIYFIFIYNGATVAPTKYVFLIPLLLIFPALFGFSLGLIISSLTTKYRDLNFVTGVLLQLLMYGSSVVYSVADLPLEFQNYIKWNPLMWVMEAFRYATLGIGTWSWTGLAYAAGVLVVMLLISLITFSKVERSFMDTI